MTIQTSPSHSTVFSRPIVRCLLGGVVACIAGLGGAISCEAVGAAAYAMSSAPDVPAAYIPVKQPTLVLVEKDDNPGEVPIESDRIGQLITAQLQEHKVVPLVDATPIAEMRSANPGRYRTLSAPDAGRATGARQVLHVDLITFATEGALASEVARGRVEARVRMVDVKTGQTLWPEDTTQGLPITVDDPYAQTGRNQTDSVVRAKMCESLSDKIAKLFYKYRSDQVDGTEPPAGDLAR